MKQIQKKFQKQTNNISTEEFHKTDENKVTLPKLYKKIFQKQANNISSEEFHKINENKVILTKLFKTRENFCTAKLEKRIKLDLDLGLNCLPRGVIMALSSIIVIKYDYHIIS